MSRYRRGQDFVNQVFVLFLVNDVPLVIRIKICDPRELSIIIAYSTMYYTDVQSFAWIQGMMSAFAFTMKVECHKTAALQGRQLPYILDGYRVISPLYDFT